MRRIRVLVVDDHGLMVEALRLTLEREQDLEVVGDVGSGSDVLRQVAKLRPDVVLLDIRLPGVDGMTVLERLRARHPDIEVVMLSAIADPAVAREALSLGARAYLDKQIETSELVSTLRRVMAEASSGQEAGTEGPPSSPPPPPAPLLTPREQAIFALVAQGRSNAEIARELWLSEQTVKYHLTNVYRKLGVKGRAAAVRFAFEHDLVGQVGRTPRGPNGQSG
jgi:DNA-binding NarL/FixJ family response regulator